MFELATVFAADAAAETTARETGVLGLLLYGARYDAAWPQPEGDLDYTDLKGVVEHLLHHLHAPAPVCALREDHPFCCLA